jgi:hypothetical protein
MVRFLPAAMVALVSLAPAATAQVYDIQQLAKVEAVHIVVHDQAKDGCLPSPDVLKVEAESILRRSDIAVRDTVNGGAYILEILPTAGSVTNFPDSCFGNVQIKLTRGEVLADRTVGLVISAHDGRVGLAPKSTFQDRFRSAVNLMVTALVGEIHKAHSL